MSGFRLFLHSTSTMSAPMGLFFSLHQFADLALLVLRIGLGAVFLSHGLGKRKLWSMQPSQQMWRIALVRFPFSSRSQKPA